MHPSARSVHATRTLAGSHSVTLLGTSAEKAEALGYLNMAIQGALGTNYASSVKVLA